MATTASYFLSFLELYKPFTLTLPSDSNFFTILAVKVFRLLLISNLINPFLFFLSNGAVAVGREKIKIPLQSEFAGSRTCFFIIVTHFFRPGTCAGAEFELHLYIRILLWYYYFNSNGTLVLKFRYY